MQTLKGGLQFLVPIGVLIYLLLVERWSPGSAVFYAILLMIGIIFVSSRNGCASCRSALP